MLGVYADAEDLINVGAYRPGSSAEIDRAIQLKPKIDAFLRQQVYERSSFSETLASLKNVFNE